MLSDAITDVQGIVQSLQQQYEAEAHRIAEALNEAEVRIAKTAWPLYLKKLRLTEDIEFIKAQLSTVEDFLKKREQDEASLNNEYQARLKSVIESAVWRFSDYVRERDYLLKGEQLVHIGSPEQKAVEVERFRSTFLEHAMTVYGNFRLNPTADLEALTHTLKTTLAEHEAELYATEDSYAQEVGQMMDEQRVLKEHLFQKQEALRQEKMSLLNYQEFPLGCK